MLCPMIAVYGHFPRSVYARASAPVGPDSAVVPLRRSRRLRRLRRRGTMRLDEPNQPELKLRA